MPDSDWDGFVLLVDDVERYAGDALNYTLAALNQSLPHIFRLAVRVTRDPPSDATLIHTPSAVLERDHGRLYERRHALPQWNVRRPRARGLLLNYLRVLLANGLWTVRSWISDGWLFLLVYNL